MFCIKCGKKAESNEKFCTNCGNKFKYADAEANIKADDILPKTEESAPKAAEPMPKAVEKIPQAVETKVKPAADKQVTKKKKTPIIIAIISLLALVLVAGFLYVNGNITWEDSTLAFNFGKASTEGSESAASEPGSAQTEVKEVVPITITLNQIDNTQFPNMIVYANIKDKDGNVVKDIPKDAILLSEKRVGGSEFKSLSVVEVRQVMEQDPISISMVLDKSGSMNDSNKIDKVKSAATSFLKQVRYGMGDQVELIEFDNTPRVSQSFTEDYSSLERAVNSLVPDGQTALYDALYAALIRTNMQGGPKCIVAFTDGIENSSVNCTKEDVIDLSIKTGIPIFMIGISDDSDAESLKSITQSTGGEYFAANSDTLDERLEEIYLTVYNTQKSLYIISYKSQDTADTNILRELRLDFDSSKGYEGGATKEFVPITVINEDMPSALKTSDYIIADSSLRSLTHNDLKNLNLVELRIARNEIFARNGREFKDRLLIKWFYSKEWYIGLYPKYRPDYFDNNIGLSKLEQENVNLILNYEKEILRNSDVFPDSSIRKLSEWDAALSKELLQRARKEIYQRAGAAEGENSKLNEIEKYNVELIDATIIKIDTGA